MKIYIGMDGDGSVWVYPCGPPEENGISGEWFTWIQGDDEGACCSRLNGDPPCKLKPGQYVECELKPGQVFETDLVKRRRKP